MKNKHLTILFFFFLIFNSFSFAKEPTNLTIVKQNLVQYHDSGEYEKDIGSVIEEAIEYLKANLNDFKSQPKKPAVVLDIDETSLSNYQDFVLMDFGGTEDAIRLNEMKANDPPIKPTLKLYQFAQTHHLAIFFVSSRFDFERAATEKNLRKAGFRNWTGLFLRSSRGSYQDAVTFKTAIRKKISDKGYQIVITIGDQESDLVGGYSGKTFKLPDPFYLG